MQVVYVSGWVFQHGFVPVVRFAVGLGFMVDSSVPPRSLFGERVLRCSRAGKPFATGYNLYLPGLKGLGFVICEVLF